MTARQRVYTLLRWGFFATAVLYLARFARDALASGEAAAWPGAWSFVPAVLAYAATAAFAVIAWHALLSCSAAGISRLSAARILCTTQIAKYLPGNIGHHLGRITLARVAFAIPASTVAASIVQEGAVACLASLLLGAACEAAEVGLPSRVGGIDLPLALTGILTVGIGALVLANAWHHRHPGAVPARALVRLAPEWRAVAVALPCYLAISLLNGVGVACIAAAHTSVGAGAFLLLTGAYALSWTVGFLLPGAPGGLGVREAALVALLGHAYPAGVILELTLWSRIATVAADLLIFCAGLAMAHARKQDGAPG